MNVTGYQNCPTCQAALGTIYVRQGKSYLFDGTMLVRIGIRVCPICGREFHWHGVNYDNQQGKGTTILDQPA